jgi:hypothetical protein
MPLLEGQGLSEAATNIKEKYIPTLIAVCEATYQAYQYRI